MLDTNDYFCRLPDQPNFLQEKLNFILLLESFYHVESILLIQKYFQRSFILVYPFLSFYLDRTSPPSLTPLQNLPPPTMIGTPDNDLGTELRPCIFDAVNLLKSLTR